MNELRYTLVTDGSSDIVLLPILTWLLRMQGVTCAIQPEWADLRRFPRSKKLTLTEKLALGIHYYPCDLLFIHRDAEREPREQRIREIEQAIAELAPSHILPTICVVPVRMQEAWLLFQVSAIRYAAGNQHGRQFLEAPPIGELEQLADPKSRLYELLRQASGLHGRRLQRFPVNQRVHRIAEFIEDFSPLKQLSAFAALETDIRQLIEQQGWQE